MPFTSKLHFDCVCMCPCVFASVLHWTIQFHFICYFTIEHNRVLCHQKLIRTSINGTVVFTRNNYIHIEFAFFFSLVITSCWVFTQSVLSRKLLIFFLFTPKWNSSFFEWFTVWLSQMWIVQLLLLFFYTKHPQTVHRYARHWSNWTAQRNVIHLIVDRLSQLCVFPYSTASRKLYFR